MSAGSIPFEGGVGLLERAIDYVLGSLHRVTPSDMSRSTPCHEWDVCALLAHLNDSLATLHEAVESGDVDVAAVVEEAHSAALLDSVRTRATSLLGAGTNAKARGSVLVAESPVSEAIVSGIGAVEVAVHGWDLARACELRRPIPPRLAEALLPMIPLLVAEPDRPVRFAAAVKVAPMATACDRLLALLGRNP